MFNTASQSASIRLVFSFVCAQNTVKVDNIDNIYIHISLFLCCKTYCTINVSYKLCKVVWKTERTLVIMDCSVKFLARISGILSVIFHGFFPVPPHECKDCTSNNP